MVHHLPSPASFLDLGHLIAITHFVYFYSITHWGAFRPRSPCLRVLCFHTCLFSDYSGDITVFNTLPWSWGVLLLLHTLIMFTCQSFLTYRFKVISDGNWWMGSVLAFWTLMQFVFGIGSSIKALGKGNTVESSASS
jgi:hypothetical protein